MAQSILGLDIGSHTVKAVLVEAGLRRFDARQFVKVEFPVPGEDPEEPVDADDDWFERLGVALANLRAELAGVSHDVCVAAVPSNRASLRPLTLPFSRTREIEMVLGQEVEELIPFRDIDEVAYDYMLVSAAEGRSELQVLVCERLFLVRFLATLAEHGFDPRVVTAGGLGMAALVGIVRDEDAPPVAVVDLGHESTTVCVVAGGQPRLWRSLGRGGDALLRRLAQTYGVDQERAIAALTGDLEILAADSPVEHHPERVRASQELKAALRPAVLGLRQTLAAYAGIHEEEISEVILCGGLAALPGLERYLSRQLKVPARRFELANREWMRVGLDESQEATAAEALSLALSHLPQRREHGLNLRRGALAFQGGYQFARGKILSIAVVLSLLVLALGFRTWATARDLGLRERAAIADLKARTQALLGEPLANPEAALARMRRSGKGPAGKYDEIPKQSAYDLFHDISAALPLDVYVELERMTIDLDRHRVELRGKTTSATAVEQIVEALDGIPCFKGGIEKEKNEKVGTEGQQLFVLTIKTSC